jgi:hypothetical protein
MQWLDWLRKKPRVVQPVLSEEEGILNEYLAPLFYRRTGGWGRGWPPRLDGGEGKFSYQRHGKQFSSEEQFWNEGGNIALGSVSLNRFRITDWFPRTPGVYWSQRAQMARQEVQVRTHADAELGECFSPYSKTTLINAGIGTIRLRPRMIDGVECWLATALTGAECQGGIPLAIPDSVRREAGVDWGDRVNVHGHVRFLQDAGLEEIAISVHHAYPLIVLVHKLEGVENRRSQDPIIITPVALFKYSDADYVGTTFVTCGAGSDAEIDVAADWMEKYAKKYGGRVITNFDEQRPILADAPLSYQRLVNKTYDQTLLQRYSGPLAYRIDQLIYDIGDVHMGHKINARGSAIININASLSNVTQTIGAAAGLDSTQKAQLEALVQSIKSEIETLKASHEDETKEIAEALEKAVTNAAKPPQERKKSLLQLSANGLKEAAALVKDIAPNILSTADAIAKFIVSL